MTTVVIERAMMKDRHHTDGGNKHGQQEDPPSPVVASDVGTGSSDDMVGSALVEEAGVVLQHVLHVEL